MDCVSFTRDDDDDDGFCLDGNWWKCCVITWASMKRLHNVSDLHSILQLVMTYDRYLLPIFF